MALKGAMVDPVKIATPSFKTVSQRGPTTSLGFAPVYYNKMQSPMYTQAPPFNKTLPTEIIISEVLSGSDSRPGSYISINDGTSYDAGLFKYAYNRAYADFQDSVNSSTSQLAATLAEAKRTGDTINSRAEWLRSKTVSLRRKMKKKLDQWKKRKGSRHKYRKYARIARSNNVSPEIAGIFIEYRWVYEATAKDLKNAVDFLQKFSPITFVKGKGASRDRIVNNSTITYGTNKLIANSTVTEVDVVRLSTSCAIGNPNLFWAQQMGLTNPAAVAWELTKFSWLIDWFGTLGEVINSWDDNLGLKFIEPCSMIRRETITTKHKSQTYFSPPQQKNNYVTNSVVKRVWINRASALGSGPFLLVRQIKGPSLVRGATAIALLVQLLRR